MKPSLRSGKLVKWKDDRGFGFIQPVDGSQEVFLHISELKGAVRRPQENDTIYYYSVADSNGKVRACNAFIQGARNKSISSSVSLSSNAKSSAAPTSNFPVVEVLLLSILPLFGAVHFTWTTRNPLPLILYPTMSLVTYALYADDKSRAKRKEWRTPEQTLHLCELAGGWLGGFIAQRILHHKSQKKSYQSVFWAIVIIHYIVWLFWLFWAVLPI
ncbi:cold shock and DUF1294 domain-containing protein [Nostocaceae cyanobacterium CENA369]|uniref:Cold shock and DUF1294 domain-containing protein n=1 Tax=Dendronalium phyllosphericum CENA369 TaxID=1725256 RepID=A0A8J7I550_9NOST|nr:cold shock and DUF1294 domain-containing protein [Dendronalium phyllosphericum]MBH8573710.1 cold shock and DUF1294 domain-containing protein [Dendronalium phyllosphericum CENA369]